RPHPAPHPFPTRRSSDLFPSLGITNAWHPLSHQVGANRATRGQIVRLFTEQLASKLIARLAETPEGDGTLLDHSTIVWGSNMSEDRKSTRLNSSHVKISY